MLNNNTATYQDIRSQVEYLTTKDLHIMIYNNVATKPKHRELKDLGKEIWQGIDGREYVNQERASWNG